MKKYRLIIHERVKDDIRRNAKWWKEHYSAKQAQEWFDAAFEKLHSLVTFPESHPLADENDSFPYEVRNILFGLGARKSYRAIFTIQEETIYVLSVQRGAQDSLNPVDFPDDPQDID